ncbi:3-phosphoserine/phosphohydroxythreonine transaminase [Oscillochloris sp. ZM17-4]|uniref:3-phosphoserine/phosphohydroxythreonine transaminase n=1 Tax=Oscillochloris sp. ZM17-4 TaxID=2866714 RepID=UPI001C7319C0|nr:3-phosphoserine/phosphohydroxythreonine transaminase [Oscillochloris sp. ZM17-4]MBX0327139.1 3-phosphoserine/phosphohydroxythreonine transaminase [Oscillochloris sp. ZM17-4]
MSKVHNFNAGPAVLPQAVLAQAQAELLDYQGRGMSILEMSHRSKEYEAVNAQAEARMKALLGLGEGYRALFLQGGASFQFAMIPLNFLPPGAVADYIVTGAWGEKAVEEARRIGEANVAASTAEGGFRSTPAAAEIQLSPGAAYIHLTTNETIQGVQWAEMPDLGDTPLIADMSSDIMSRPFDAGRFAMIYAGAQKNIGPAGVTVVVIREDLIARGRNDLPAIMRYSTFAKNSSLYNTPPAFSVYLLNLVLGWITDLGGLPAMEARNRRKAELVYGAIDGSGGFYRGHAAPEARSQMNVTFRLPEEALEKQFVAEAQAAGMVGLGGHRSVGGIRASIYNALEEESCAALASFMGEFLRANG